MFNVLHHVSPPNDRLKLKLCVCHLHLKVCGPNEEFKECGTSCPANCTNQQPRCPERCVRGCFCKPGFIRDPAGKCVRPDQCPTVCGENEVFLRCGSACAPNCTNPRGLNPCPLPCVRGCFCRVGFVRDPSGRCVLPQQCPVVCGQNEEFKECGTACPANCTNPQPRCPERCVRGCFCKPGFVRDPAGKCVRPDQCPLVCGVNEVFLRCGTACPPNCTNPRGLGPCPQICVRGCFCRFGFVRDPSGKCVLPQQCPVACGPNEEFNECGTSCPANCTNLRPQCPERCVRGCFCRPGFVRNPAGRCVRPNQCPTVCGPNEEFQECGTACPTNCSNPVPPRSCPEICVRGCFCKRGFIRDSRGRCVRPEQCPVVTVCGENEAFDECGTACPTSCENPEPQPTCPPICRRGCFCRPGFVRDQTRKCVRPEQCPINCGPLEVFKECGPVCPANCTHPNPPRKRPGTTAEVCVRGCFCREGLLRSPNGDCVKPQLCPSNCSKPNEEFLECGPQCIDTCQRIDPRQRCENQCVKGCFCITGFVRDIDGNCIRPSECPIEPQKCPPGERFYVCKPTCGATCDTLDPASARACTEVCQPGCFCQRGLVRTRDGRCVRPSQCPRPIVGRRIYNDDDETTSANPLESTTIEISTQQDERSTNPTTLGTSIPPKTTRTTALTTPPTETTTVITTETTAITTPPTSVSTISSTTPTPTSSPTPTTRTTTTRPIRPRRYRFPTTPLTTKLPTAADETQTASASSPSTLVTTPTSTPAPVTTPIIY